MNTVRNSFMIVFIILSLPVFSQTTDFEKNFYSNYYSWLRYEDKELIQSLINLIDCDSATIYSPFELVTCNTFSSGCILPPTYGEKAAYLIDYLIVKYDSPDSNLIDCNNRINHLGTFLCLKPGRSKYRNYNGNIITKKIQYTKIKQIYQEWWDNVKHLSFEEIRKKYRNDDSPLPARGYFWMD